MVGMYSPSSFSLLFFIFFLPIVIHGGGVFEVKRKFAVKDITTIDELLKHDDHHHARLLQAKGIDIPLGGQHLVECMYYTEVEIGTPPKNFTLHVDTGSDVSWVNCVPCQGCTDNTEVRERMTIYDPKSSETARTIKCDESLCERLLDDQLVGYKFPCKEVDEEFHSNPHDAPCPFLKVYGDGGGVEGSYVTDLFTFNQVSGDHKTKPTSANITFGCASKQKQDSKQKLHQITHGVDGLIGFSQTSSSFISQLASSGKASKMFAHCLNANKGGGVFAIGHVAKPKVRTTPLIRNMPHHYHVNVESIQVGDEFLQLPAGVLDARGDHNSGTILDTGSTLNFVPPVVLKPLIEKVFLNKNANTSGNPILFNYQGLEGFPTITMHFEGSLTLEIQPKDYIIRLADGLAFFGFMFKEGFGDQMALGDISLTDKLFVFDLEKQTVGWTDYNCSSGIEIEDEETGDLYEVDEHDNPASDAFCAVTGPRPSYCPNNDD